MIPDSNADPIDGPTDDAIMRMITNLRSGNAPGSPGGYHNGLQLTMTTGEDGLVRQITLTFQQYDSGSSAEPRKTTWNVTYSQLGNTPAIVAPPASTGASR